MMSAKDRVLQYFADHGGASHTFETLRQALAIGSWRLDRILRKMVNHQILRAEIVPGNYPNLVRYSLTPAAAAKYVLPEFRLADTRKGLYKVDALLDEASEE